MAVISSKFAEYDRAYEEDEMGRGSYTITWMVRTNQAFYDGGTLIQEAESVGPNPIPQRGDTFIQSQVADLGSFCRFRNARLIDKEDPYLWQVQARYEPLKEGESSEHLTEPNPLNWPIITWTTWKQLQIPIEEARLLTDLSESISRGATPETTPGGPIVNACGQQTIDPMMKTVYHPILNIRKNYTTEQEIIDLNDDNGDTVNSDTFYGGAKYSWQYLLTKGEGIQRKAVQGVGLVEFVPGVTQFEYKKSLWTRKVLNNGLTAFKKDTEDPPAYIMDGANKKFHKIMVTDDDGEKEATSEPLNLNVDGTFTSGVTANNIEYLSGAEVAYGSLGLGGA